MNISPLQYAATGYLDVYKTVAALQAGRNTLAPTLNTQSASYQVSLSDLGKIQTSLQTFQSAAQRITGSALNLFTATSSTAAVATATATSAAATGSYALQVTQLAQAQTLATASQATSASAIGSGAATVLKFDFGTTTGAAFAINTAAPSKSITIDATNNSLQGIANAVNKAGIGVTARVAFDGVGYKLAFTSSSGAANSLRITATGDASVQNLLNYDPAGIKNLTQTTAAQDAALTVNGVVTSSATNQISSAVQGVTFSLMGIGSTTVAIAPDAAQIAQNIGAFVSSYNALQSTLKTAPQGRSASAPNRTAIQTIQNQLQALVGSSPTGTNGLPYTALAQIGITTARDGSLTVDDTKLRSAISANPINVNKLFTNKGDGIADRLALQAGTLLSSTSPLAARSVDLRQAISSADARRATLASSLTTQTSALIQQYTRLSLNLSALSNTSAIVSAIAAPK